MQDAAKKLKALADETRLRTLLLISHSNECCVCEIQEVLELPASTASRQLRILEEAGWVTKRREGKWMHYRMADVASEWRVVWERLRSAAGKSDDAERDIRRYQQYCATGSTCSPVDQPLAGEIARDS